MKKVLVLIFPQFAEFEITVATDALAGSLEIVTIAPSRDPVKGESGLRLLPDLAVDEVNPDEYEAIIIPGGQDMFQVRDNAALNILVRKMYDDGKLIAAVCAGPYVLGQVGILNEVPYTTSFLREHRDFLGVFNEENFRQVPVVEERNVITAEGMAYAEFGLLVAERLGVKISDGRARFFLGGHERFSTDLRRGLHCTPEQVEA
jgi:protein deglycase